MKIKYFTPKSIPNINTIILNAWVDYDSLEKYSNNEILKIWQYRAVAECLRKKNTEPKGYVHKRHFHILPQIATKQNADKIRNELYKRNLQFKNGIDLTDMFSTTTEKKLDELKLKLKEKQKKYNYLYGNKKGAWATVTAADEKRSNEIDNLVFQIENFEFLNNFENRDAFIQTKIKF